MKICVKNKVFQYVKPFCCNDMNRLWDRGCVAYLAIGNKVIIVLRRTCMIDDQQIRFCPFCGEEIQIEEIIGLFENKIENHDRVQDLPRSWAY